MLLTTSSAAVM